MASTIMIADLLGTQLQGRVAGRKHYARLVGALTELPPGEVAYLDFSEVEIVTGSWVNAALVPLFRWAAAEENEVFPVILNAHEDWLDDLRLVADWTHQCYLVASGKTPPKRAVIYGPLDAAQRDTLAAVLKAPGTTGARLADENVRATAWNNRLKDLHGKRLLRREKRGREQVYSPVVAEMVVDG